jgi:hypothetical protein
MMSTRQTLTPCSNCFRHITVVLASQTRCAHGVDRPFHVLLVDARHIEHDHRRGRAQPLHVPVEEERLAVVRPDRFVDALTEQEPVIEHRDRRVRAV